MYLDPTSLSELSRAFGWFVLVLFAIHALWTRPWSNHPDMPLGSVWRMATRDLERHLSRLGTAAAAHDAELVVFHFSRLLDSCTRCHSAFASERFPGFAYPATQKHHH